MQQLGFFDRFFFAWVAFFRVLLDGQFAARAKALGAGPTDQPATPSEPPAVSAPVPSAPVPSAPVPSAPVPSAPMASPEPGLDAALQLLALLQEHGRFVDFLQEDVTTASDADLGAAARVVHQGCRRVLAERADIAPLRSEEEGAEVVVPAGFSAAEVKLTGALRGEAPFRGILRHRGWIARKISLPRATADHRADVLAQAEVEL